MCVYSVCVSVCGSVCVSVGDSMEQRKEQESIIIALAAPESTIMAWLLGPPIASVHHL